MLESVNMWFVLLIHIAGYYLTQYRLGVVVESALVTAITVLGCVAGYALIRRVPGIGVLFGVHRVSGFHQAAK